MALSPRCDVCSRPLPAQGRGRPRMVCPPEDGERESPCRRVSLALADLARLTPVVVARSPSAVRGRTRHRLRVLLSELREDVLPQR